MRTHNTTQHTHNLSKANIANHSSAMSTLKETTQATTTLHNDGVKGVYTTSEQSRARSSSALEPFCRTRSLAADHIYNIDIYNAQHRTRTQFYKEHSH